MKTKLLKGAGFLFAFALMFASFAPVKAQAANWEAGDAIVGGDTITYDGYIYLYDEDGNVIDSGLNTLTVKESYVSYLYDIESDLFPTAIVSIDEQPGVVHIRLDYGLWNPDCDHNIYLDESFGFEPEGHVFGCSRCGEGYRGVHDFIDGVTCRICGMSNEGSNCNHAYFLGYVDETTHAGNCVFCFDYTEGPHNFIDGKCDSCGTILEYILPDPQAEVPVETPVEAPVEVPAVAGDLVYTVKAGDTLGSISANYYGNNSKGSAIYEKNKEVLAANKGQLVAGMQIILPEKFGNKSRVAEPTVNFGEVLYTVMHGDTLAKIAKEYFGVVAKYADVFARNNDRLMNADTLFPGQVIVLPAK